MKKIIFWLAFLCSFGSVAGYTIVDGTVLKVNLDEDRIVSSLALPTWASLPLKNLVQQAGGVAGINAAYFCPDEDAYHRCGQGNKTTSDRIHEGKVYSKWGKDTGARGILGFTKTNDVLFVQNNFGYVPGSYEGNTNQERFDEIYFGIGNFPILLDQGVDVVDQFDDVIDAKMKASALKGFICHTRDEKTVYMGFVPSKTIYEMPGYIKEKYGCYNAINIDAGGSAGLYDDGRYVLTPWRNVVDAFVILEGAQPAYKLTAIDRKIVAKLQERNIPKKSIRLLLEHLKKKKEEKWIRVRAILAELLK